MIRGRILYSYFDGQDCMPMHARRGALPCTRGRVMLLCWLFVCKFISKLMLLFFFCISGHVMYVYISRVCVSCTHATCVSCTCTVSARRTCAPNTQASMRGSGAIGGRSGRGRDGTAPPESCHVVPCPVQPRHVSRRRATSHRAPSRPVISRPDCVAHEHLQACSHYLTCIDHVCFAPTARHASHAAPAANDTASEQGLHAASAR